MITTFWKYLLLLLIFANTPSLKAQTFILSLQTPQGVFDAINYAAYSGDTTILKFLCPPKVDLFGLNGDHRQICRCETRVVSWLQQMKQEKLICQIGKEVSRKVIKPQIEEITFLAVIDGEPVKVELFYCFGNYYLSDW